MLYLTADEHRQVLQRLIRLHSSVSGGIVTHKAGMEYTSLMVSLGLHSRGAAESILALHRQFGYDWFPVTTGCVIVRSQFEVDVTAHYLARDPVALSRRYIEFGHVIRKKELDTVKRHRTSKEPSWREAAEAKYKHFYALEEKEIERRYSAVRENFEDKKGRLSNSWSGKSLAQMAREVDHVEAYDVFYADLSSFAHANVAMADHFLRLKGLKGDGPGWSQKSDEGRVANVFRYAAIFMTCFLTLFGKEFSLWDAAEVDSAWSFAETKNRQPKF